MLMGVKERLGDRVLEYLRTRGYSGMGVMSRELGVSLDRVKWALRNLAKEGKVEMRIYGCMRVYRGKTRDLSESGVQAS